MRLTIEGVEDGRQWLGGLQLAVDDDVHFVATDVFVAEGTVGGTELAGQLALSGGEAFAYERDRSFLLALSGGW